MTIKILCVAATALMAVSCSPKALIKDQSGTTISVKKIKNVNNPLTIRFSGGSIKGSFKSMSSFSVNPSVREIYAGQTWIQVEYSLKKDKSATTYTGWIPQLSQLSASSKAGDCTLDLATIQNVDFMMGKKKAAPAPKDTTKSADSTSTPPPQ